jgi:predicted PurR-regulated permease PerM
MTAPLTRLQRTTYRVWLAVGILVLLATSILLLTRPLAVILGPALVALLVVYLLNPLVSAVAARGVPRLLATLCAYLLIGALLTGVGALLLPLLADQITGFAEDAPDLGATLRQRVEEMAGTLGLDISLPAVLDAQVLGEQASDFVAAEENRGAVEAVLGALSGFARGALALVISLIIGPVVAFYVLADLPNLLATARRLLPPPRRQEVEQVAGELTRVVGGFVRGQLLIALLVGVASSIVLGIAGLPYYLVIGTVAGITNLVPLLGPFVAGALGVSVALVTDGLGFAVLVALLMTGVQQLESSVLSPLIMGHVVRVHPLVVLLGVLVAAALFGIVGMLVVVPLIAGAKVLAQHLWQTRVPWAEDPEPHDEPPDPRPAPAAGPPPDAVEPARDPIEPTTPLSERGR